MDPTACRGTSGKACRAEGASCLSAVYREGRKAASVRADTEVAASRKAGVDRAVRADTTAEAAVEAAVGWGTEPAHRKEMEVRALPKDSHEKEEALFSLIYTAQIA